jgi:hypothetical protein
MAEWMGLRMLGHMMLGDVMLHHMMLRRGMVARLVVTQGQMACRPLGGVLAEGRLRGNEDEDNG